MPAQVYWFATGAFAMLMTLAWLFIEKRVTSTTILAAFAWAFMAISGNDVFRITETGTRVEMPVGLLQYFCVLMAVLSFLAAMLYRWGYYPPVSDDPTTNRRANKENV